MTAEYHGRIVAVTDETEGDYLASASLAAATSLVLEDAYPFDEAAGTALLDDGDGTTETVTYTAV